jgi:hypothetical protein
MSSLAAGYLNAELQAAETKVLGVALPFVQAAVGGQSRPQPQPPAEGRTTGAYAAHWIASRAVHDDG